MGQVIAVTGATGYVGYFVVHELLPHDVTIRALRRRDEQTVMGTAHYGDKVEWITGDLLNDDVLEALVSGADVVIHLAYAHVPGRYRGGEGEDLAAWLEVNVNGSLRLLMAAQAAGVKQFVFLSSRAVFSRTLPGRVLDETHPTTPDTHYGAYKVAIEAFLRSFEAVSDMRTLSLRTTGVYGVCQPVARSKWWPLVTAVMHDQPITSRRGGTEVYGGDVARTIWLWLTQPSLQIDLIHLSDLYVTNREIVALIRESAGRAGPLPLAPEVGPTNVLVCPELQTLGMTLGGWPKLKETIAQLVTAFNEGMV